jgi:hypothetical protein
MPQKQTTYIQQSSISSEIRKRALSYIKTRPIKRDTKKMVYLQRARKSHKRNQEAVLRQIKPDLDMLESAAWVEEID